MFTKVLGALALVGAIALSISAVEVNLEDVKCLVNPNAPAKEATGVEYKEGKVFFCCGNCAAKFKEDSAPFAAAANHQLVRTGQYTQAHCPLSGGALNPEKTVEINGVSVQFCCGNCQGKVAGAEGAEQVNLVFGDAAFTKGFEVVKEEDGE